MNEENDFLKCFQEMAISPALLSVLTGCNRSTLHTYLQSSTSGKGNKRAAPASAMALIRLLQLVQARSPEVFQEWLLLQDFQIAPEEYLHNTNYRDKLKLITNKMNPSVKEYLEDSGVLNK
jgi:hypothetical protein